MGDQPDAISLFMMDVNGRYATYRHALERRSGKFWQGRFYSCVLDDAHWETALRYVELNPIRSTMRRGSKTSVGPPPVRISAWSRARLGSTLNSSTAAGIILQNGEVASTRSPAAKPPRCA